MMPIVNDSRVGGALLILIFAMRRLLTGKADPLSRRTDRGGHDAARLPPRADRQLSPRFLEGR
ncbi:MAG: hypothetical protein KDM91_00845, partial [Verrucomicrobiae bacterium]|nr:hypothetical protein [Verrucomicrobiae bacterium]